MGGGLRLFTASNGDEMGQSQVISLCVCVCIYVCVCLCVCKTERQRDRDERDTQREGEGGKEKEGMGERTSSSPKENEEGGSNKLTPLAVKQSTPCLFQTGTKQDKMLQAFFVKISINHIVMS